MKRFGYLLLFSLLLNSPIYATVPSIKQLTELKKSLTMHVQHFMKCVKGHEDCSKKAQITTKITVALIALVVIIKGSSYILSKISPTSILQIDRSGGLEKLKQLIINGKVDVNAQDYNGTTPLHIAIKHNDVAMVKFLLQRGAHINYLSNLDTDWAQVGPPLHFATAQGNTAMMQMLINHGAQVNFQDDVGTPLSIAIKNNKKDAVLLLLKNNADIGSSLYGAVRQKNIDIALALIQHGANINARDEDGETPLFYGAMSGNIDIVQLLLDHGADPTIINNNGDTAADMTQDPNIKHLLQSTPKRAPIYH